MTPEQKAAYINSQVACANIKLESMKAANLKCILAGQPPIYNENDILGIMTEYGIHHNAIMKYMGD